MTTERRATPKRTGKRFGSVAVMLKERNVSAEVQDQFREMAYATEITRQLASMRATAGFTQEQLADRLGVTQSCISKWESGLDEELSLKVLADYARATDSRLGIFVGKPLTHVEAVKSKRKYRGELLQCQGREGHEACHFNLNLTWIGK